MTRKADRFTDAPSAQTPPQEVLDAVRTLIRWAGDNPDREGLRDTPRRVAMAWREYCQGYDEDPGAHLERTFSEISAYQDPVILRDIPFVSHCEHHLAPIVGKAHIAYLPKDCVVGISKLARVVHAHARRLQVQERMTADIARTIHDHLGPHGVAVVVEATHGCMTARGVQTDGALMVTRHVEGLLRDDPAQKAAVFDLLRPQGM